MKEIIAKFPEQIREAVSIAESVSFSQTTKSISNVLVCGLGGSGIGGKISGQLFADELPVPFNTVNDYDIPAYVGEKTLIIASSYSGNTEETIAAVEEASKKGSEIAVITSGGKLLEMAKENGWNHAVVPGGEQPRAMLVYSIVQQINFLIKYGLIHPSSLDKVKKIPALIEETEEEIKTSAKQIAGNFENHIPIIYAGAQNEGMATRFRQQLNENSKVLCWHHVLPEMTHNELVGWAGGSDKLAIVYLGASADHERTVRRWEVCQEIIRKKTTNINEIKAKGENKIEQLFYLIHFTDWVSLFLSELRRVDPVEVDVIGHLKAEMAKMK